VDGVGQFPKSDFVVVIEPVEVVLAGVLLLKPEKAFGATVVLLVDAPNNEDVVLAGSVEAAEVVVMEEGCTKAAAAGASPKIGLKFWTGGPLCEDGVAEDVVVVAGKMGLNPAASSGLVLLTD